MANVPEYSGRKVLPGETPSAFINDRPSLEAFGGGESTARVYEAFGKTAEIGAGIIAKQEDDAKRKAKNTLLMEKKRDWATFEDQFWWGDPTSKLDGVVDLKGKAAGAAYKPKTTEYQAKMRDVINSITDPDVKYAFTGHVYDREAAFNDRFIAHVDKQISLSRASTYGELQAETRKALLHAAADITTVEGKPGEESVLLIPNEFNFQLNVYDSTTVDFLSDEIQPGDDRESAIKQTIAQDHSKLFAEIVQSANARGDDITAMKLLEKFKGELGDEYFKLKDHLDKGSSIRVGNALADGHIPMGMNPELAEAARVQFESYLASSPNLSEAVKERARDKADRNVNLLQRMEIQGKNSLQNYVTVSILQGKVTPESVEPWVKAALGPHRFAQAVDAAEKGRLTSPDVYTKAWALTPEQIVGMEVDDYSDPQRRTRRLMNPEDWQVMYYQHMSEDDAKRFKKYVEDAPAILKEGRVRAGAITVEDMYNRFSDGKNEYFTKGNLKKDRANSTTWNAVTLAHTSYMQWAEDFARKNPKASPDEIFYEWRLHKTAQRTDEGEAVGNVISSYAATIERHLQYARLNDPEYKAEQRSAERMEQRDASKAAEDRAKIEALALLNTGSLNLSYGEESSLFKQMIKTPEYRSQQWQNNFEKYINSQGFNTFNVKQNVALYKKLEVEYYVREIRPDLISEKYVKLKDELYLQFRQGAYEKIREKYSKPKLLSINDFNLSVDNVDPAFALALPLKERSSIEATIRSYNATASITPQRVGWIHTMRLLMPETNVENMTPEMREERMRLDFRIMNEISDWD
jgi:hypothetical protein